MWYAVMGEDVADSLPMRQKARDAHIARLKALAANGRVLIAGPHPAIDAEDPGPAGFSGSLIVVDFPSLDEAKDWASKDPYLEAGVYSKVTVKPFKRVLP
ncbi:MAG: YciI family protein [Gammaproteobacteria bacterium]|nr:YciI family protein [Gammaproteobacteria bacterium]MDH4316021.1 YciI family protein [Gammaproteobacteria bacterium]MDH5215586.1 YciI family protein [Gammaproteobacteria bacterium]MDH5501934.1 YciI family protein [Gammaproteobacteria bacterium]